MPLPPRVPKLGQALVRAKVLDEVQLASVLGQCEQWGQRIGKAIVNMRLAKESVVVDAIAQACGVPAADAAKLAPDFAAIAMLDSATCKQRGVFPIGTRDGGKTLELGMADPSDLETVDAIAGRTRCRIKPVAIGENVLERAVQKFYEGRDVQLADGDEEAPIAELDEIKLVDVAGKTLMVTNAKVSLKNLAAAAAPVAAPAPAPAPVAAAARPAPAPAAAAPMGPVDPRAFAALQAEVVKLRQSQENAQQWLRAIVEVLVEKQVVTAPELKAKMRR